MESVPFDLLCHWLSQLQWRASELLSLRLVNKRFLRACSSPHVIRAWSRASHDFRAWHRRTCRSPEVFECVVDWQRAHRVTRVLGLDYGDKLQISVGALRHLLEGAEQAVVWALRHPVPVPEGGGWYAANLTGFKLKWEPRVVKESSFTLAFKKAGLLLDPDGAVAGSDEDDSEWKPQDDEEAVSGEEEEEEEESSEDADAADVVVWELQKTRRFSSFNEMHQVFSVLHGWLAQECPMSDDALRYALELMETKPHLLKEHECVAQKTPLMVLWESGAPCSDYFAKVLQPLTRAAHQHGADLNARDRSGRTVLDYCCWNLPPILRTGCPLLERGEGESIDWCRAAVSFLCSLGATVTPFARMYFPQLCDDGSVVLDRTETQLIVFQFAMVELVSKEEAAAIAKKAGIDATSEELLDEICIMFKWAFELGFRNSFVMSGFICERVIMPEDTIEGARLDRLIPLARQ